MLFQNPYAPPLPAGTFPGVYGDGISGLAALGRGKRKGPKGPKAPMQRQRWTSNQKRQMPSIARRLPTATKGGAKAVRKANQAKAAAKQAQKAAPAAPKPAPAAVLPPPAFFTEPEAIGTPYDVSPQSVMDQAVVGADEYPVDLSTDLFADATAPPGEYTDLDSIIVEEYVEEYPEAGYEEYAEGMQGLGSWLSKTVRKVAPIASLIPGAAQPINALFPQKAPAQVAAPKPAAAAPKPATVVRKVVPAASAAKPAAGVSPVLVGIGVLAGFAVLTSLVSVARK